MTAASPAEWAAAGFCGLSAIGLIALAVAFADAELSDFDPRPAIDQAIESGRLDWLLNTVANAKHDTRAAVRQAAVTAAALLMLLTAAPEATQ